MNTIYVEVMSPAKVSVNDAIIKAIERNYNTYVKAIHDEAKGYCFKGIDNKWRVAPFDFINMCADLGSVNHCLLNY
jgi:predicted lipase